MKGTKRSAGLVAAAAGLMIIGAASVAWACTQQAFIGSISPGSGPAGSRATVTASNFNPGPVQIRWNGTDGPLLATASGPDFSVGVTIPNATPSTYTVVAVQREGDVVLGKASVSFSVTPASSTMSGGFNSSTGGATTEEGQAASGSASRSSSESQASAGGSDSGAGSVPSGAGGAAFPAEGQAVSAAPSPAPASATPSSQTTASGSARVGGTGSGSVQSPFTDPSATPTASSSQNPIPATTATEEDAIASPSARSATADLWGGFASGDPTRSAGLDAPASGSGSTSPLALGAGLLSGGLGALFAGFGVAEYRRRRVLVTSHSGNGQA